MTKNPMNRRKPTEVGDQIRDRILEYLKENEILIVPVSLREIGERVGISSTSVVEYHLIKLESQGLIEREAGKVRYIKLIREAD